MLAARNRAYIGIGDTGFEKNYGFGNPRHRLSTIWFDEIVADYRTVDGVFSLALDYLIDRGKLRRSSADELLRIWQPVPKEFEFKLDRTDVDTETSIGRAVASIDFMKFKDQIGFNVTDDYIEIFSSAIAANIHTWSAMQVVEPISYVTSPASNAVLNRLHDDNRELLEYEAFFHVFKLRVPDFSEFGWDEIVEIRHNPRLEEFRSIIRHVYDDATDLKEMEEIFEKLERDTLVEIAKETKPDVRKSISVSILGNLPSPVFVNPFGVYDATKRAKSDIDRNKKYSWLYFLLEVG